MVLNGAKMSWRISDAMARLAPPRANLTGMRWVLLVVICVMECAGQTADNPIQYELMEDLLPGSVVGNIKSDAGLREKYTADVLRTLSFSFLTAGNIKDYFEINNDSGDLLTARIVDRDVICPQAVECVVRLDIGVHPHKYFETIKVDVKIIDVNDNAPQFSQDHLMYELSEGTPPGILFPINLAIDTDSPKFGVKRYELIASSTKFQLSLNNNADGSVDLRLVLAEPFDREAQNFYKLQVIAKDGGSPPKSGTLTLDINVLDVNDNSPKFLNDTYKIYVSENMQAGSKIAEIRAVDPDDGVNGEVKYSFTSSTQRQFGELFRINPKNGDLKILEKLDYERQHYYSLVVVAEDKGADGLPSSTRVEVHVHDENDNQPEIVVNSMTSNGIVQVRENEPVDTFVAHISVIDQDAGDNGRVRCRLDDLHFKLVEMLDKEFKILTAVKLDREDIPQYKLHIECTDRGMPRFTATASLSVTVLDVNDHAPQFILDRYEVELEENNHENQFLMQVKAHDEDVGANGEITYEMGAEGSEFFSIDPKNGAVAALKRFDREQRNRYEFTVVAKDNSESDPQMTDIPVVVRILDADDEKPKFLQNKYTFSVYENQPGGTEVGQVLASDPDLPPNNKFSFYLDAIYTPIDTFQIDPDSGVIYTKHTLDRERQEVYHLTVLAQSDKNPHLSDTAQIEVFVTDKNDNAPAIIFPTAQNNTIHISNHIPVGHVVTQIIARDPDFGENGHITYFISEGTTHSEFVISPETGRIMANVDLADYRSNHTFPLVIMVKDNGRPQKMSVATLNIVINRSLPVIFNSGQQVAEDNEANETLLAIIVGAGCGIMIMITAIILAICLLIRQKKRRQHRKDYFQTPQKSTELALGACELKQTEMVTTSLVRSESPCDEKKLTTASEVSFALTLEQESRDKTTPLCGVHQKENGHLSHHHHHPPSLHHPDHHNGPERHITGLQDSDSGCYADLSHTDSQGSNDEANHAGGGGPHLHPGNPARATSHHYPHPHLHGAAAKQQQTHQPIAPHPSPVASRSTRSPRTITPSSSGGHITPGHTPTSTPFTDWVQSEGHNLKRKGNVYRVSNPPPKKGGVNAVVSTMPGSKSVRFHEPRQRTSLDLVETDIINSSSYDDFDVIMNLRTGDSPTGGHKYATLPNGRKMDGGVVIANGYHNQRPCSPQKQAMYDHGSKGRYQRHPDGSLV